MELWEDDASGNGFTADLIRRLRIRYPEKRFAFVIGSDNLSQLPLWREYEWLRENLFMIVITRPGYDLRMPEPARRCQIKAIDAPDISSSQIRALIASGQPLTGLLPQCIEEDVVKLYTQGEQHR
jgi:nicotinate-nucleotide adenylyltransferase